MSILCMQAPSADFVPPFERLFTGHTISTVCGMDCSKKYLGLVVCLKFVLLIQVTCSRCCHSSVSRESYTALSLQIGDGFAPTVEELLGSFSATELMRGDNQ